MLKNNRVSSILFRTSQWIFFVCLISGGCASLKTLIPTDSTSIKWITVTDQETLDIIYDTRRAVFGLTKEGQIIAYPKSGVTPYEDTIRLSSEDHLSLWVEEVPVDVEIEFTSSDHTHRTDIKTNDSDALKEVNKDQQRKGQKDSIKADELSKTEADHQVAKTHSDREGVDDLEIEIEGEEITSSSDEEVIEIEQHTELTQAPKKSRVMLKPAIKYIVYVGCNTGLFARILTFSDRWEPIAQSEWVSLHTRPTRYLLKNSKGEAWWGGSNGIGVVRHGQVKISLGNERVKLMTIGQKGLFISTLSDEVIFIDEEGGKKELTGGCPGPILAMSAHPNNRQLLVFCGSGIDTIYLWKNEVWTQFKGRASTPMNARLKPLEEGWIYRSQNRWSFLTSKRRDSTLQQETKSHQTHERERHYESMTPIHKSLWHYDLALLPHLSSTPISSWHTSHKLRAVPSQTKIIDTLMISQKHSGIKVISGLGKEEELQSDKLSTGNLSAHNSHRPFMMTANGHLLTITQWGALSGDGHHWHDLSPPDGVGQVLGIVDCSGELLWITSQVNDGDFSNSRTPFKRSLEVWNHHTKEPKSVIDWSSQSFRKGSPSLGETKCATNGLIYANLFWGAKPRKAGIGLLIIDQMKETETIWEQRQGYDGEADISPTPLLPYSKFNAIEFGQNHTLHIATNSGLFTIKLEMKTKDEQLLVYDEANGWPTEFFNDLRFETFAGSRFGRLWIATSRGLLNIVKGKRNWVMKEDVKALAYDQKHKVLWVGLRDQLWLATGLEHKEWYPIKVDINQSIKSIVHIFPKPQGGVWLVTTNGVFSSDQPLY
jgi:hypothetical protein